MPAFVSAARAGLSWDVRISISPQIVPFLPPENTFWRRLIPASRTGHRVSWASPAEALLSQFLCLGLAPFKRPFCSPTSTFPSVFRPKNSSLRSDFFGVEAKKNREKESYGFDSARFDGDACRGFTGSILVRNGKLSDLLADLQNLLKSTEESGADSAESVVAQEGLQEAEGFRLQSCHPLWGWGPALNQEL
ncbi:hypothetical protein IEQ34_003427 [Dendrobium chrysotoxum]|uniref:Uncharacterized protein n=1 Tax=Dendrobium chrysotoxum TaxID=161865 RepID=A0AAV7HL16_DENCH|nr:hypothetical protein IEQ34_003427 [Dendrobium chrysotoxum]